MTAREMFKDLGYECRLAYQHICYVKHGNDGHIISMIFDLDKKTFCSGYGLSLRGVSVNEFLAIQKQMKELGWLDEKTCENLSEYNLCDRFKCSNCGIVLEEYQEIKVDEDDDTDDECTYEYTPNYCPNCGRKIID